MKRIGFTSLLLTGTILASGYALAADPTAETLPAVSGINGKIEASGGWIDLDDLNQDGMFRGGASLTIPVGDMFGIQADISAVDAFGSTMYGGAAHFFARDPNSYLFGIVGGVGDNSDATVYFVGPEAEFYLDNFSIEMWGGYMNTDFDGGPSNDDAFGQIDLGFYASDNLRFTVGASSYAGFTSARAGLEWQLSEDALPLSLTADARLGEDGFASISAGIKMYFGGESKSLMRRHREDDPPNRSVDVFSGIGNAATPDSGPQCPPYYIYVQGEGCVYNY